MKAGYLIPQKPVSDSASSQAIKYSTDDLPANERSEWLHEVIGREYANVEITPPADGKLFNEMIIYPWKHLRLSSIRSSEITLKRKSHEPNLYSQDAYFAVILLSGNYHLQQNGRDVFLQPGDISLYDATLAHQISCSESFSKLIISIPRPILRDRIAGIEHCTALRIPGYSGIGAIVANFICSTLSQTNQLTTHEFSRMSEYSLDLLTLALATVRPEKFNLSKSRSLTLNRIKAYIEEHLSNSDINPTVVANDIGLSPRYINTLFRDEDTSLMRYIWQRRLENSQNNLLDPAYIGDRISDIAFRWGFNDLSHFSRTFKQRYDYSPKDYRQKMTGENNKK
jgi:AraC-like DNA-binding protein